MGTHGLRRWIPSTYQLVIGAVLFAFMVQPSQASRSIIVEFAGSSGGVVTGAGDAWVVDSNSTICAPSSTTPASCGIDFSTSPSTGNTTPAINLGFTINIGGISYSSVFINRFGYITFGSAPADGGFSFAGSLAALTQTLTVEGSVTRPFIAPFQANLVIPDGAVVNFAPFAGGASYFRGSGDPIAPFNASEVLPAFAVTWIDATHNVSTQLVIYQKNTAGDFYLALRYGQEPSDSYDISATSALPAVAGFALTDSPADQLALTGPLPDASGYFYTFQDGHLLTTSALTLTCPAAVALAGTAYSSALSASGGIPADTFAIIAGNLPSGLHINPSTGVISGTPTAIGPVTFTAQVSDSSGLPTGTVVAQCTITVNQPPAFTSGNSVTFAAGVAGSFNVTAKGYPAPTFTATGLPSGVTLTAAGLLSGTATSGTYGLIVTAHNGIAPDATQNLRLSVTGSQLSINPGSVSFGTVRQYGLVLKTILIKNTGTAAVKLSGVSITPGTGTSPLAFTAVSLCGSSLGAGKQCTIAVLLFAVNVGSLSATLNIADSAAGSPQTVPLTATVLKLLR